jgi:hypothetical protein
MSAVSAVLLEAIKELQALPSLQSAILGGGTSLALRYSHRESVDIDLFFPGIIGKAGFEKIKDELYKQFDDAIIGLEFPCDIDDQFLFLRFYIRKDGSQIKVDIMQNMCLVDDAEEIDGVRVLSVNDIGLLKLMSASNRITFKDIYDLHYITEEIPLPDLMHGLKQKEEVFNKEENKTIFALDEEVSPVTNPALLLKFDEETSSSPGRPSHSILRFDIVDGISWLGAKRKWRRKVQELFNNLNIPFSE